MRPLIPRVLSCQRHGWPSISTWRCRQALAAYPMTRASSPYRHLLGLAPDEACHATYCYQRPGGLLHRRFTLTRRGRAVCSLLRYLSGHPGRTLSAIVLYGARKFLNHACKACPVAAIKSCQTHNYTSIFEYKKPRKFIDIYAVCSRRFPKARLQ